MKYAEKISFTHPTFGNNVEAEFVIVDGVAVSCFCNIPEFGDLNRGDINRTYENLKGFIKTFEGAKVEQKQL